jgi:hypothetical protein
MHVTTFRLLDRGCADVRARGKAWMIRKRAMLAALVEARLQSQNPWGPQSSEQQSLGWPQLPPSGGREQQTDCPERPHVPEQQSSSVTQRPP